jgi:hypothetical protein
MSTRMTARMLVVFAVAGLSAAMGCGGGESSPDAKVDGSPSGGVETGKDLPTGAADSAVFDVTIDSPAVPDLPIDIGMAIDGGPDAGSGQIDATSVDVATPADVVTPIDGAGASIDGAGMPIDGTGIPIDGAPMVYSCGAFAVDSGWKTATGFRSSVVAKGAPLSAPVALTFAAGAFGGYAYIVDQGTNQVLRMEAKTGATTPFINDTKWPTAPQLLTTVLWDADGAFDGRLYVGDQGSDGDADSTIFRSDASGLTQVFATAPGPGLDDIYGMVFSPGGVYPAGLFVSGDTDGSGPGFGVFAAAGTGTTFATFSGVEGLAVDKTGRFGGGLFASMPAGGGYSGDDTLSPIKADGSKGTALVSGIAGIHAVVFAPAGPFGGDAYVASWSSQKIIRIKPDGTMTDLASGLSLTNYDGNILAFSPDGRILFVADRSNARIVCIEPST